ncbi:MAG TPA: HAMP domain-containing sensor histidine kinase, partial [Kofleriaceae bacterium]
ASLVELQAACSMLRSNFGRSDNADEIIKAAGALNRLEATIRLATQQLHSVRSVQPASSKRRRGLDLAAELDRFASLSGPLLEQHDTTFVVDAPRGSVLRTDMRPELFSAVISSLTLNSLEWRQKGKPMTITAAVRIDGEFVEVTVQDSGKGVTLGLENTVFEPMVSGRDGTGMGLTIARSILETHGGSIELLVDRRRKGATFKIRLPRKKARSTVPTSARNPS